MIRNVKPILDALEGKRPERVPVWLMRQAGRYLPEYRELRSSAGSFLDLCLTPELAVEITLQPIKRFGFDAAIIFADILLVPHALGQKLEFREGRGPILERLEDETSLQKLYFKPEKLAPVMETVSGVKGKLPPHTALIGFCGGMWTVAAYMIEGGGKTGFDRARSWAAERPELLDKLIGTLLDASERYLCDQIEAGAEVLQIFESWAGLLSGAQFDRFVIEPTREIVNRVKRKYPHIPVIGFPREAGAQYRSYAANTGIDALSIDQHVSLDRARNELKPVRLLQGNLDPLLLVGGGGEMRRAVEEILDALGPSHIFNLGHGVLPETPVEHVAELVQIVRGRGTSG